MNEKIRVLEDKLKEKEDRLARERRDGVDQIKLLKNELKTLSDKLARYICLLLLLLLLSPPSLSPLPIYSQCVSLITNLLLRSKKDVQRKDKEKNDAAAYHQQEM